MQKLLQIWGIYLQYHILEIIILLYGELASTHIPTYIKRNSGFSTIKNYRDELQTTYLQKNLFQMKLDRCLPPYGAQCLQSITCQRPPFVDDQRAEFLALLINTVVLQTSLARITRLV